MDLHVFPIPILPPTSLSTQHVFHTCFSDGKYSVKCSLILLVYHIFHSDGSTGCLQICWFLHEGQCPHTHTPLFSLAVQDSQCHLGEFCVSRINQRSSRCADSHTSSFPVPLSPQSQKESTAPDGLYL